MERVWTWLLQLITSDAELDLPLRSEVLCLASLPGIESNFWPVTSEWATFSCYLSKVPQVSLLLIGPMLQEALSVLHEQENRNPNSSVSLSLTSGTFLHWKVPALQLSRWCHCKTLKISYNVINPSYLITVLAFWYFCLNSYLLYLNPNTKYIC